MSLNGPDDINLKHAFLNSFPQPLGDEAAKLMKTRNIQLQTTILRECFKHICIALDSLCNKIKFLKQVEELDPVLKPICKRPDLTSNTEADKIIAIVQ